MAIEVRIPKEITEYREKIILGLNIRQLFCSSLALFVGITTYILLLKHVSSDIAGYILMIEVLPIFALGFFRKDGFNFEQYLWIRFRHYWSVKERTYETELSIDRMKGAVTSATIKRKKNKDRKAEAERFTFTKSEKKRRYKAIRSSIKKARTEYKRAKQDAEKAVKKTETSKNSAEYNSV